MRERPQSLLMGARRGVVGGRAVARAAVRRLRHGPTVPTRGWAEELFVAAFRDVARVRYADLSARRHGPGLASPIARSVRRQLSVSAVDLGGIEAERYLPLAGARGTILRFHGGGFVSGSYQGERRAAAELATLTGCDTYGIAYRLAPEHPYPAAVDDAVAAYRGLLARGAEPAATVLFGGSAGAGLALAALLRIRAEGLAMPAGCVALWPYADFTFSGASIAEHAALDMLPLAELAGVWGPAYVGGADPADPMVSPALADLTGLPPLLVLAGGVESLRSCAEQIADHARRDGVAVTLSVYPGQVHGWMMLPWLPATRAASTEVVEWIRTRLDTAPTT